MDRTKNVPVFVFLLVAVLWRCGGGSAGQEDAAGDAGTADTGVSDVGIADMGLPDTGRDGAGEDAGPSEDAGSPDTVVRLAQSAWPMYQHDPRHTGRSDVVGPAGRSGVAPELVAGGPAGMPLTPDGLPAGPPPAADGEVCCGGFWAPITIGATGDLFIGSIFRYDFDSMASYFAGEQNPDGIPNPGEVGPSGLFYSLSPEGVVRYRFDNDIGSAAISAIESGALITSDGTAIFGKDDGHVYALDPEGKQLWQFPAPGPTDPLVDVFDTRDGPCTLDRAYGDLGTCYLDGKTCQDNEQFGP
ncbi:MAG: PQQ-binding-like beta-propeller repeat protein, partial [Deltaproteobacteria bacterium]|nr:PQQ-binding-like beta-propeller repeat protein [Deltaproteobacteria bacterium]